MERLLTPEELALKTEALTGYMQGRQLTGEGVLEGDLIGDRRLLYGGIDSEGVVQRSRDMTPVMAAVARAHAVQSGCPIAAREFYFLPDGQRLLFNGTDLTITPYQEIYGTSAINGKSHSERETVSLAVSLTRGEKTVRLRYPNNYWDPVAEITRNLIVDKVIVQDQSGSTVANVELETLEEVDLDADPDNSEGCDGWPYYNHTTQRVDGYELNYCRGWLDVPISIAQDGDYVLEVVAFQIPAGDESARLEIMVESDSDSSQGALAIRRKLVELYDDLLGVTETVDSPEVEAAFRLFVDVWDQKRTDAAGNSFWMGEECPIFSDHFFMTEVLGEEFIRFDDRGNTEFNWDAFNEIQRSGSYEDPNYILRTWAVVLTYLLADYRYLYF